MVDFKLYDYLETQTSATVIADSISNLTNSRITTMLWRVPEIILPQLNTHRVFSRNVASNRAKRFSVNAKNMTYTPVIWLENHKGMQSENLVPEWKTWVANIIWGSSKLSSYIHGWLLDKLGISKQYTNRLTTPYRYTDYLVTSTEWDNFFYQRDDNHAQFEIQVLARKAKQALKESVPTELKEWEWHLPFITANEKKQFTIDSLIKLSVARCARTSYTDISYRLFVNDNTGKVKLAKIDKDMELYNRLVNDRPPHLSPTEHQAQATYDYNPSGNLSGVLQYRKILEYYSFDNDLVTNYLEAHV